MFSFVNFVFAFCFLAASNCPWLTEQQSAFVAEDRTCECIRLTTICNDRTRVLNNRTAGSINAKDTRDYCDFRCAKKCEEIIKQDLGNELENLNSQAFDSMCKEAFADSSENRGGICLISVPVLDRCENDNHKVLEKGICCRYCDCNIIFSEPEKTNELVQIENFREKIDHEVYNNSRWFKCSERDNDLDCERDCREEAAKFLGYPDLKNLDRTDFRVSENQAATNKICKSMKDNANLVTVHDPGRRLYVGMSTGNNPSDKKYISLGNVCCERSCSCEVFYKDTKTSAVRHYFNLTPQMATFHSGYNCNDELKQCLADCKKAVGEFFKSEELEESNTQADQLKIFHNYFSAFEACDKIRHVYKRPDGINVSFKYSTAGNSKEYVDKNIYPYTQELFLGKICCENNDIYPYFPYGIEDCKPWTFNQIGRK